MFKLTLVSIPLLLLCSTASAQAPSVDGDKAMQLARALKFAGLKETKSAGNRVFKAGAIHCNSTFEADDEQLGTYSCSIDKLAVKGGAAFLLQDAMEKAGISANDHMSQHTTDASAVVCTVNPQAEIAKRFSCVYAAAK